MHFIHCYHANDNFYDARKAYKIPTKNNCHDKRVYIRDVYDEYCGSRNKLFVMNTKKCCICNKTKYCKVILSDALYGLTTIDNALCDWYDFKHNNYSLPMSWQPVVNSANMKKAPIIQKPTTINELVSAEEQKRYKRLIEEDMYDKLERVLVKDVK